MGRAVIRLLAEEPGMRLCAALTESGDAALGIDAGELAGVGRLGVPVTDQIAQALEAGPRVAIDFTSAAATVENLGHLVGARVACVIGTTGFTDAQKTKIGAFARRIALVMAPNMSTGANVLFSLVRRAAELLGDGYDCEVVEAHHVAKKDAPSGTALRLAERVAEARGWKFPDVLRNGRAGANASRGVREIGMHALRMGDVVGEHRVLFSGRGETVELRHQATSRDAFARGALRAARFAAGAKSGLYGMDEVLSLSGS